MKINKYRTELNKKGFTVDEFLQLINRSRDWFYRHSVKGKDHVLLGIAIKGVDKNN
tara:strand:+ start:359 stop:526 length:168 start_codon:yes stop_codon:yes gene_type:complete